MPPSDINVRQGPVAISSKDPKRLDGYLRFHQVRDFSIRADGPGIINEICVAPSGHEFRLTGVSEVSGVVDEFEVSLELRDRVVGWVRMRWILIAESEGALVGYNEQADDLLRGQA